MSTRAFAAPAVTTLALLTHLISTGSQPALADPAEPEAALFGPAEHTSGEIGQKQPWELRHRIASVNWRVLKPLCSPPAHGRPDKVTLNLFSDVTVQAEADRVGRTDRQDSLRWNGEVVGLPDSSVTFAAIGLCDSTPRTMALAGSVKFNGEEFTIRPRPHGHVIITEIDSLAAGLLQKPAHPPAVVPEPSAKVVAPTAARSPMLAR